MRQQSKQKLLFTLFQFLEGGVNIRAKKKASETSHCHKNTLTDTQIDTPFQNKHQHTDWPTSAVLPPEAESLLCGCVQPSGLGGRGRSFPKDKLGSLRETMPSTSSPVSQAAQWICWFRKLFSASYSTGLRRDFEPENAPTGHSDSVCLVFLLFPRRLYQVRRTNIYCCLCCASYFLSHQLLDINFSTVKVDAVPCCSHHIYHFIDFFTWLVCRSQVNYQLLMLLLLLRRKKST